MPVDQPIELDVVVVLAEGIDQDLCHLKPSYVETKLKKKLINNCERFGRTKFYIPGGL